MYTYTHLEDFIKKLYSHLELDKKPPIQDICRSLNIRVVFDTPASYIKNEIILIEKGSLEEERENFAHELGHYLRDIGRYTHMPALYIDYVEYRADHFMYHFLVPSFMLQDDPLPFCKTEATRKIVQDYGVTKQFAVRRLDMYERKLMEMEYYY